MPAAGQPFIGVEHMRREFAHRGSPSRRGQRSNWGCGIRKSVYTLPTTQARFDATLHAPHGDIDPQTAADRASSPRARARATLRPTRPARQHAQIVESITTAIVERRLMPGTKLAEQKIADIFKVSRTLVRQALNQLSRDQLVTLEPARGARVAEPSVEEARQVFEVRNMLEAAMIRAPVRASSRRRSSPSCAPTCATSRRRVARTDVSGRTRLLADFHVVLARMLGNEALAQMLGRPAVALLADRADVPVGALGRALVRGARGDRRCARAPRRARRGQADGRPPAATSSATCSSTRACPTCAGAAPRHLNATAPPAMTDHRLPARPDRLRPQPAARALAGRRAHRRAVRAELRGRRRELRAARRPGLGDLPVRDHRRAGLRDPPPDRWSRCTSTARASASGASCASSRSADCRSRCSASSMALQRHPELTQAFVEPATRSPATAGAGSTTSTWARPSERQPHRHRHPDHPAT